MSDDALKFNTGNIMGEWKIIKASGRYAVCKFTNERMRITSDGVFFGETLRTIENSLETHWFSTWEFADLARRSFTKLDAIGENFGRTRITFNPNDNLGIGVALKTFPPISQWKCYLFGAEEGFGITYQPHVGNVPNAFVRWCMKTMLGCTWVKGKA